MWKKLKLVFLGLISIALLGLPAYADWDESNGHKMHFPQLPDEVGWDVACMEPNILADDWQCSQTGVVDDIHFWGSWRDINGDHHGDVGIISSFRIRIFTDIPEEQNPDGFSKPGMILRDWTIGIANVTILSVTPPPQYLEGWLDPTIDPPSNVWYNDHDEYFQYNIVGLTDLVMEPFIQDSNTVYWLGISAVVEPITPQPQWGWKSSTFHFNDDAVVGEPPIYDWQEIYEPPRLGNFNVTFSTAGTFQSGNGTNYYDDGTSTGGWYFYENTDWWNIWFYDNPFSYERKKTVQIEFTVRRFEPIPETPGQLTLAVNYSNPEWPPDGPPPLPPLTPADEELYVGRDTLVNNMPVWDTADPITVTAEIPYFNPEWVSIDVSGYNFIIENGSILHECVGQQTGEPQSLDLAFVITGFPVDTGACCYGDPLAPTCVNTTENDCINNLLGTWYPNDDCDDPTFVCPTGPSQGACCYPDQTCLVMTQADCEAVAGNQYMGDGTDCTDSEPNGIADICETPEPQGACCLPGGSCTMMTQTNCEAITDAWYVGDNIHCLGDLNTNGINDICETDTTIKWEQMPDLDLTGMDISAFNHPQYLPYLLADDFQCTQTGPITRIDIWGSWYEDNLPMDPPAFVLSFHSDIPAAINPHGPYSEPGELLWLDTLYIYDQWIYASGLEEGWFEPPYSYEILGDTVCWQYSFTEFDQPFIQMGTETEPVIYWLDVQVLLPMYENAFFGWKTSLDHWNDDATWVQATDPVPPDPIIYWNELRYPDMHPFHPQSIDLAFRLYGEEEPDMGACCYPDQTCLVTTQSACESVAGNQYMGDGTDCTDGDGNSIADICETPEPQGACCLPGGSCATMTQAACEALVGAWYVGDNIHCQGDFNSNGINDLCETDTTVKWEQLPDLDPTGMDISAFKHPQFPPYLLADDFRCGQTGPITRIDIWGSWYQDSLPLEPPGFVLSFHRDIPADPPQIPYSMPGELLWLDTLYIYDQLIYASSLEEGWFEPPSDYDIMGDTVCWRYSFSDFTEPFIQMGTPEDSVTYWLDVQVLLPFYERAFFGWKTSLDHWNDDAVWIQAVEPLPIDPPPQWLELRYPDLHPFHPQSIDLAFRIYGEEEEPQTGACCYPDGNCADLNQTDCLQGGGIWGGIGSYCMGDGNSNYIDDACEGLYSIGACCFTDQSCIVTYQDACETVAGGTYMNDGTDCTDGDGNLIADICEEDTLLKWEQFPDLEPTGMDVTACQHWLMGQKILADDFQCTQYGPITEIVVWGSWNGDILPAAPPSFVLSFHADIPEDQNPYGTYSMPGELLWLDTLSVYEDILFAGDLVEGWFDPPTTYMPNGDTQCWMYRFTVFDEPFIQHGTPDNPVVYWLDVQAVLPFMENALFGWKTSLDHWNDDAVWIQGVEPLASDPPPPWNELIYPDQHPLHPQSIDLAFAIYGESHEPPPDTCTYYKSPYPDYAPNGMPDFDQKQDTWITPFWGNWSYCGPTALADCFWWFDSKFEPNLVDPRPFWPDPTSPAPSDGYPLVQSYEPTGAWDDHDLNNVMPFIQNLAMYCMTDANAIPGTIFWDLVNGANNWITDAGLTGQYTVTPVLGPDFYYIRDQILISQDVILLLGIYEILPTGGCQWIGGHYVTSAGVCSTETVICISDPMFDGHEGEPPAGSAHGSAVHNDAFNISGPHGTIYHDRYNLAPNIYPCPTSPATWMFTDYPTGWPDLMVFEWQNPINPMPQPIWEGGELVVLLDAALIICPVEPEPDIDVVPDTVGYQRCIETDTIYTAQFQVCNTGTASLTVTGITCDLGFVNVVTAMPIVIPSSTCADIDIRINTTGIPSGPYTGDFHVSSNDPDEPVVNKPHIRVDVVEQDISVSPDSIYHEQAINTIVDYLSDFTIYNNGPCPLNYSITYSPPWATLTGATGNIPPANNDPIDVRINTNTLIAGTYVDSVRIISDDPDTPILYRPKIVLVVTDEPANFDYLPGDVNMSVGAWAPAATGPDVTYLVNYFRGYATSVSCLMHNPGAVIAPPYFWASADANGDCNLIGSDVTKLVNVFRGIGSILYCSDYPPNYPPIPGTMPAGWPNCATLPLVTKTVIPTEPEK